MNRFLKVLTFLLVFAAGCRHTNTQALPTVPTLPASHGHLSLAMDGYLKLPTRPPGASAPIDMPEEVVEPAQAPTVFAEAVQVLKGQPTKQEIQQAWVDLDAACVARLQEACGFLRDQFKKPERLEGELPPYPAEAIASGTVAMAVFRCRLGVDGKLRSCEVLEQAPYGFTEAMLESIEKMRYQPAALAGHPVEISYTIHARMAPRGVMLTPEEELQWVRRRAEGFPKSTSAWFGLAEQLAKQAPEDPGYVPALQHLNELDPRYWWSANELAWTHAQAGRYAQAAPFARRAREGSPLNAYVLEASAATLFGIGQCAEALADQRNAVERLPAEWPAPERERFQRKLQEYTQRCSASAPATAPTSP